MKIGIINGPNINMIGIREPEIYGRETWYVIEERLKNLAAKMEIELIFFQSNVEGFIVDFIQENLESLNGIIINPAAYTKNGYAILDALTAINTPFVEVHLSNIYSRGGWHSESIFAEKSIAHICGFKGFGYDLGLRGLIEYLKNKGGKYNE
jgi:3-dehydroquinate dehydratase II